MFYARDGRIVDAALALELDGAENAEADCDAVGDGVVGGPFDGVTEGVAEVQQKAFLLVELVDLNEPFLGEEAIEDDLFESFNTHAGVGIMGQIAAKGLVAAAEANLYGFDQTARLLIEGQRFCQGWIDEDSVRRMEGPDQILVWPNVDRGLAADAGIHHSKDRRGNIAPGDLAYRPRR